MTKVQIRRGTTAQWLAVNPVLSVGEVGLDTNTGYIKIGNGSTTWSLLPFFLTTELGQKAPVLNPSFSGTVSGVTKAHVGLGSVDNTSDSSKPVSTAQQTALNGKANTVHTHSAADMTSGFLPDARLPTRLGTFAASHTDWDLCRTNGWYMSSTASNAPATGWFIGSVEAHNDLYLEQTVTQFTGASESDTKTWRRHRQNGTFGPWYKVLASQAELDARYAPLFGSGPLQPWRDAVQNRKNQPVIFASVGDSISAGGNATTDSRNWLYRLKNMYTARNMESVRSADGTYNSNPGNDITFYTGGVGGRASWNYIDSTMVTRFGVLKPLVVSHIIGTNDYAQGIAPATFKSTIKSWVDQIQAVSPNTVHMFVFVPERIDGLSNGISWDDYGAKLKELAVEYGSKGVFVDVNAEFKKQGPQATSDRNDFWHPDNLHFNNQGNKALADILADALGAPKPEFIPREFVIGTQFPPAYITANGTVSTLRVEAKPYLREGMTTINYYCGATQGTGDLYVLYRPVGSSTDSGAKVIRLHNVQLNHALSMYVSLEPNTAYDFRIDGDVYGNGRISFGGSGPYYTFAVDLSPA